MQQLPVRLILNSLSACAAEAADRALAERPLNEAELGKPQTRRMQGALQKKGYDAENHTVTMSVSSETPISRYGGFEVLSHAAGAIDTGRLDGGIALLYNHDWDVLLGRSTGYQIKGGELFITNRFGSNPDAKQREQDVADGILVDVSIGYQPTKVDITEDKQGVRTYNVTNWELFENSLVTVPADYSVGVNRSAALNATEVVVTFRKLTDDPPPAERKADTEDEDEDEEDEEAGDGDRERSAAPTSSPTTNATQERAITMDETTTQTTANAGPDLAAQERARVQGLHNLRTLQGAHYTERQLAEDISTGVAVSVAMNAVKERVIASAQNTDVRSAADTVLNDMSQREQRSYSQAGQIRAAINLLKPGSFEDKEAGFAREVSDQIRKEAGSRGISGLGDGILTPGALNERYAAMEAEKRTIASGSGSVAAATNFTDVIVPPIALLRTRMYSLALGARMIPLHGTPQITRQNAAASSSWLSEGQAVTGSDLGLDFFTMSPHRLSMQSSWFRDFLALSNLAVDTLAGTDRNAVLARSLDYAVPFGSGVSPVPMGFTNRTGIGTTLSGSSRSASGAFTAGQGGVPPTFVDLNAMEAAISTANADIGTLAWLTTPKVRASMRSIPKIPTASNGETLMPDSKVGANGVQEGPLGYNLIASSGLPTNYTVNSVANLHPLIFGVWSEILIGDWDLNEIIPDAITGAAQALYKITEHGYYDTNVEHLECFNVMYVLPS